MHAAATKNDDGRNYMAFLKLKQVKVAVLAVIAEA